jgi:hypothetical protein
MNPTRTVADDADGADANQVDLKRVIELGKLRPHHLINEAFRREGRPCRRPAAGQRRFQQEQNWNGPCTRRPCAGSDKKSIPTRARRRKFPRLWPPNFIDLRRRLISAVSCTGRATLFDVPGQKLGDPTMADDAATTTAAAQRCAGSGMTARCACALADPVATTVRASFS